MNRFIYIVAFIFFGFETNAQLTSSSKSIDVGVFDNGNQVIRIPVFNQSHSDLMIFQTAFSRNIVSEYPEKMKPYQLDYIRMQPSGSSGKHFKQIINFTVNGETVQVSISGKFKQHGRDQDCEDFSSRNARVKQDNRYIGKFKETDVLRIYSENDKNSLFSSNPEKYPYSHFVVLIDASGSMGGFNKLETLKSHLESLVNEMRPTDYISVLTYNEESEVIIDYLSGMDKELIKSNIMAIEAGGFTNGKKGIESALAFTRERQRRQLSNQVIMLTDGDFNLGDEHEELLSFLLWQKRSMKYKLSVMTVGSKKENQKEMKSLSKTGNGYYFNLDEVGNDKEKMNKLLLKQLST